MLKFDVPNFDRHGRHLFFHTNWRKLCLSGTFSFVKYISWIDFIFVPCSKVSSVLFSSVCWANWILKFHSVSPDIRRSYLTHVIHISITVSSFSFFFLFFSSPFLYRFACTVQATCSRTCVNGEYYTHPEL